MNNIFVLRNPIDAKRLYGFLKSNWLAMAQSGKPLAISITEAKSRRSIEQNKRLHKLLSVIAAQAWVSGRQYSVEAWKEWARQKFIGTEEIDLPSGNRIERGISTTTLSVSEFSEFMDRIEHWAVEELAVEFDYA